MIIITLPFTAYADNENGNGTGDAGSSGTHIFAGGAASYKSAYLIYIVDGNGNLRWVHFSCLKAYQYEFNYFSYE